MATFVLVHGGGHGGWCWDRLVPLLHAAGHSTFTPTLTGVGERFAERTSETSLSTHIADVVSLFDDHCIERAILLGHSYGGMVITGAADRLGSRVARLVYLDAPHPRGGESLIVTMPGAEEWLMQGVDVIDDVPLTLFPTPETLAGVFGLTERGDIEWAMQNLTPHPLACFLEPLELADEAAFLRIPRASIDCARTLGLRTPALIARIESCEPRFVFETGHDLMITEPRKLADALIEVARCDIAQA
jgi:pimeloyl-ACP methyl ester carboxylesterase